MDHIGSKDRDNISKKTYNLEKTTNNLGFVSLFLYLCIMKALLTTLLLMLGLTVNSQSQRPWDEVLADVMTAEDMESETWEDTYEMLCELEQQPLNLNTATREELEALPFLSAQQVEGIMEYRDRYGLLRSMNELMMIKALDYAQIELLRYFTCVGDGELKEKFPSVKQMAQYGKHELMGSVRIPFYKRKGDDPQAFGSAATKTNSYLGYPYRHWLRYEFNYKDYVKIGAVASQDAGEPFFSNRNGAGYDFYSYYVQVKHWRRVEQAVVGKYKLSVGMGLVANNSFSMGKLAMLQQLGRNTSTLRPHSSRSQTGYFQGAAATVRLLPSLQLTAFASYRGLDATLNDDGTMRTIVTSGYHRTATEMEKKDNTHATDAGVHAAFRNKGLHIGATALYTHFDRELIPQTQTLYKRHYAQGNDFVNVSMDYGYLHQRFALNGETAINRQGAVATINSVSMTLSDGLSMMVLQRFYGYRYTALYARSLSEGGRVQNESAVYLGATWQPSPRLRLQAYTDYAYFAWARYQVSQSSMAWDNLLNVSFNQGPWSVTGRYRLHLRQKDNDTKTALRDMTEQRGRLQVSRQAGAFSTTTQVDGVWTSDHEKGYMLSEALSLAWKTVRVSGGAGYFHTDSYDTRLYVYERSPLYNFSFPTFYGKGYRLNLMVQGKVGRRLTLTAKLGFTHYLDRNTIGSGLQEINSASQTDADVQVKWKM